MKIEETCSCGATFSADDGARSTHTLLDTNNEPNPRHRGTEVERQAQRWRVEHRHVVPSEGEQS